MITVYDALPVSNVSSAVIVKLNGLPVPVVGVPLMVAVGDIPVLSDRPSGNAPDVTLHVQQVGSASFALNV